MPRLIHKYSNRRLYDTHRGRTITLPDVAEIVLRGEKVRVEHRTTREDITTVTLLYALVEWLKQHPDDAAVERIAQRLFSTLAEASEPEASEPAVLEKAGVGVR